MRRARFTFVVLLASLWFAPQPAAAAALTFPSATITDGNPFDVNIQIANIDQLYAFFFNVAYNPAVVELLNVQEGTFLSGPAVPPNPPPNQTAFGFDGTVPGTIGIFNVLIGAPAGISGSGSLAIITFRALVTTGDAGIAFSDLSFAALPPPCNDDDNDCPVGDIPVNASPGQILIQQQTTPVPEPATFMLFGLGVLGLARRLR